MPQGRRLAPSRRPPLGSIALRFIPFPPIMHQNISPRSVGFEISLSLSAHVWLEGQVSPSHHGCTSQGLQPPGCLLVSQRERLFTLCCWFFLFPSFLPPSRLFLRLRSATRYCSDMTGVHGNNNRGGGCFNVFEDSREALFSFVHSIYIYLFS